MTTPNTREWEEPLMHIMGSYIMTAELGHLAKDQLKHKQELRAYYAELVDFIHQELQKAEQIWFKKGYEDAESVHKDELQKAREEERERIIYVTKNIKDAFMSPLTERRWLQCIQFTDQPKPKDQSELDQPNK